MRPTLNALLLTVVSGLLFSLAHPSAVPAISVNDGETLNTAWQGWLAFFALVPVLFVWRDLRGWRLLRWTFLFSLVYFGISLYWINVAMVAFGQMALWSSALVYGLLMLYLSSFWALWLGLAQYLKRLRGLSACLAFAIVMTAGELVRNYLFSGFPWQNPAYSQWANPPLLQTAGIWGIYGLTFLIFAVNGLLFDLIDYWPKRRERPFPRFATGLIVGLLAFSFAYGYWRLDDIEAQSAAAPKLKAALIQGNINQDEKNMSAFYAERIVEIYRQLSRRVPQGTELVVWPEAAFPFTLQRNQLDMVSSLRDLYPTKLPFHILTGVDIYDDDGTLREEDRRYYNSAILIDKDGKAGGLMSKTHLVPGGEYVPFREYLPVDRIVPGIGLFYPGELGQGIPIGPYRFGVLICYEGIFPEIANHYAAAGVNFLVNITNDAWYGTSSAPYQHLHFYVFRAVEAGRSLLRAANTGFSTIIAPDGRIVASTQLFTRDLLSGQIPLLSSPTIYSKLGDLPAWLLFLLVAYWSLSEWRKSRQGKVKGKAKK